MFVLSSSTSSYNTVFIVSWASSRMQPSIPYASGGRLRQPFSLAASSSYGHFFRVPRVSAYESFDYIQNSRKFGKFENCLPRLLDRKYFQEMVLKALELMVNTVVLYIAAAMRNSIRFIAPKLFSSLAARRISRGFIQLLRSRQRLNKGTKGICLFCTVFFFCSVLLLKPKYKF